MSWNNKVVWSEGMFLRPQHFQQQDRHFETLLNGRVNSLRGYDWGVIDLQLDHEALSLGKLSIAHLTARLPDGTPIRIPDLDQPPTPLDIDESMRDTEIVLALPIRRPNVAEIDRDCGLESVARYAVAVQAFRDTLVGQEAEVEIEIGHKRLRLLPKRGDLGDYAGISLAKVREIRSDQSVILDEQFIPPCLDCRAAAKINGYINEILGLLNQRSEVLAARVNASGQGGVAEIADFLLLQTVNRWQPLFDHLSTVTTLHPEAFYQFGLMLAGELATFTEANKRPGRFSTYDHDALQDCLQPLIDALRQSLSMVMEQNAIQLPLQERKFGIRVSPITDRGLLENAAFILAVRADIDTETLLNQFPKQTKIGPVEHIRQLVNAALPGVELRQLPVAPRQIPFHSGTTYFELRKSGEHWNRLSESGGFAIHVAGNFPGLEMAFWAIKG